LELTVIT